MEKVIGTYYRTSKKSKLYVETPILKDSMHLSSTHPLLSALLNIEHNSSCVGTESKLPVDSVDVAPTVKCDTGSGFVHDS